MKLSVGVKKVEFKRKMISETGQWQVYAVYTLHLSSSEVEPAEITIVVPWKGNFPDTQSELVRILSEMGQEIQKAAPQWAATPSVQ